MSVSTPVGFLIYNRPDLTERVFEAIAEAKPKKLYVIADGPRNAEDYSKCLEARAVVDKVDWNCQVYKNYSDYNLGCGCREASGFDWVFSQVEEAIFVEDDTLPCRSFFSFCENMLEKYRHDGRIMHINGDNSVNVDRTTDSYYFSKYMHGWGWASWRRAWRYYDYLMKSWPEARKNKILVQSYDDNYEEQYWTRIFDKMYANPEVIDTWDYQWTYACWLQKGLVIAPNKNLISNIGFNRTDAVHTKGDGPRANLPTSELSSIKHPLEINRHKAADQHTFDLIFGGLKLRAKDELHKNS